MSLSSTSITTRRRTAVKAIDRLPPQAAEKYTAWLAIVQQSGPQGLRAIKGFHDEKLSGNMATIKKTTVPARPRVILSPGDMVRVGRELQEMTQAELAAATGIAQGTISSIESGRVTLGAERAEKLEA